MVDLQLTAPGLPATPSHHLSVDGMSPQGPNLSHWPGNRTPIQFKADLSTGICLNFARAEHSEQEQFLSGATAVLNDHYDTDGFLSLLSVLRPELALAHEELCLAAAATGDFQAFQTWRGFAVDRIVLNLTEPAVGLTGAHKDLARYRWLLEHAETILTQPERFADLWERELEDMQQQLEHARRGGLIRELYPEIGLAVVRSEIDYPRMVLNSLAGGYRVLHLRRSPDGLLCRYHDRTESWFELVSFHPLPRTDLRPLARSLETAEGRGNGTWVADPATEPVPELFLGIPAEQAYGQVSRRLLPSRLPDARIVEAFVQHFATA